MSNNGSYQLNSQWNLTGVQCNIQCPITNPSMGLFEYCLLLKTEN